MNKSSPWDSKQGQEKCSFKISAKMILSGAHLTTSNASTCCRFGLEVDHLNHCVRSSCKLIFRSGNCCGSLIGHVYFCPTEDLARLDRRSCQLLHGHHYIGRFRCSSQTNEKVPSVLYANLNSCLSGWISQIFSANFLQSCKDGTLKQIERLHVDSDIHSLGLMSPFSLECDSERSYEALHTYPTKSLELRGGLLVDSHERLFTANTPAEMEYTGLVSPLTCFHDTPLSSDLRLNRPDFSRSFAQYGVLSAPSDTEKAKAELCAQNAHCVTPHELGSPEALALWLSDRLPFGTSQLKLWGTAPGTKRVANLWIELVEGEISLEDASPPKRTVHVASVKIKNDAGHLLIEAHQEMADGSIRLRNRPLSEKMRPGENVEDACFRGICEELGCQLGAKNRVTILSNSYRRQEEERESLSYPGLLTSYVIHSMDATVDKLPEIEFYTVENEMTGGNSAKNVFEGLPAAVGVKKHFWRWVS